MSDQYLAFMIGLLGSVHCIGMCGPLAFAVPSLKPGAAYVVLDKVLYQVGRILSYSILGLLIGLIGRQMWMAGLQQWISITTGLLIIVAACSRILKFGGSNRSSIMLKPFNKLFGYALKHKANHLIIGMINGLLPCGFVYLALAGALNTGTTESAAAYMFWFGVGTSPLMLMATISMAFTGGLIRKRINKVIPYMMVCLGLWFILRGMDLNIPYLSPSNPVNNTVICK